VPLQLCGQSGFGYNIGVASTEPIITDAASNPQETYETKTDPGRVPGLRLAVLAGVLMWLANPPCTLWPLAWVGVAPLILSVTRAARLRQALWRGYLFGWVFLGATWYWIGLTIGAYTHDYRLGWAAWFGLTLVLAGFYALWGGAAWWLARRTSGVWRLVAFAASWVVMEWLRTLGTLSMPWAQLSYTQYRFSPVLQIAEFTGAYGVSFLMLLVNAALAEWWPDRTRPGSARRVWISIAPAGFACLFGLVRLLQPETGMPLTVADIQSNFDREAERQTVQQELQTFAEMTQRASLAADPPPTLYVWSETAAPRDALNYPPTHETLAGLAERYHAAILVGSRVEDSEARKEANASILFVPGSNKTGRYDKQHLVAFGEFIPFRHSLPDFLDETFHFPPTDVTPGISSNVLRFSDARAGTVALGPFICYESMFPPYARAMTREGATLLVTQSNDDWFQSVAAMEQHLAAVVLRAIENRREVVRSTTTGITCLLDSRGRVIARAPLNTPAFLVHTMHLREGKTLYTRLGDWFVGLCILLTALAWRQRRRSLAPSLEIPTGEDDAA
jgi:apolipoprotein N-acyltransferase